MLAEDDVAKLAEKDELTLIWPVGTSFQSTRAWEASSAVVGTLLMQYPWDAQKFDWPTEIKYVPVTGEDKAEFLANAFRPGQEKSSSRAPGQAKAASAESQQVKDRCS